MGLEHKMGGVFFPENENNKCLAGEKVFGKGGGSEGKWSWEGGWVFNYYRHVDRWAAY